MEANIKVIKINKTDLEKLPAQFCLETYTLFAEHSALCSYFLKCKLAICNRNQSIQTIDLVIQFLGIYIKVIIQMKKYHPAMLLQVSSEENQHVPRKISAFHVPEASPTTAKTWKQPKCQLTVNGQKRNCGIDTQWNTLSQ